MRTSDSKYDSVFQSYQIKLLHADSCLKFQTRTILKFSCRRVSVFIYIYSPLGDGDTCWPSFLVIFGLDYLETRVLINSKAPIC